MQSVLSWMRFIMRAGLTGMCNSRTGGTELTNDILMKGFVATYLASPQGQMMIHSYLSSAEGQISIREYFATIEGKQTARAILPLLLEGIDVPDEVRISVRDAISRKS
jgi:hypothetical protein